MLTLERLEGNEKGPEGEMERERGFEPPTSTLARLHSTTELFPLLDQNYHKITFSDCQRGLARSENLVVFILLSVLAVGRVNVTRNFHRPGVDPLRSGLS